jgi:hypothetical protein
MIQVYVRRPSKHPKNCGGARESKAVAASDSVLFFTSDSDAMTNYTVFANTSIWANPTNHISTIVDTNELRFSLEGEYQYQALNKPQKQYFLVPISFETNSRTMSALGMQTNIGNWHPIILESY